MWTNFTNDIKYKINKQKVENPVLHTVLKWLLIILIIILIILLVLFILLFIVLPIVFAFCIALQRLCVFWNIEEPKDPQFEHPEKYGYQGVKNFYITSTVSSDNTKPISIGAWWVPQENYINSTETMEKILANSSYPVVLYNHGVKATRIIRFPYVFGTLRKFFHIVAIDYRSYGDSDSIDLTEDGVVIDVVNTYNLMKTKTKADIFIWGHSLGGGISTHAAKWLKDEQNEIIPGLVIESSFSCLRDEIYQFFLTQIFKWLPWFDWCVTNPIYNNGFLFNTMENTQQVDCPIMMMHSADDPIIPYF
ncbi:hypothetical protein HHI36_019143 [Cryptolaemus montrouzieri]|uniref:AB hydrolase-1 domain-containing protein n=1 Tax=Cryptolaemus montrouzieri TaxID=559131 RepID=A0ABD2P2K8_9CUCU